MPNALPPSVTPVPRPGWRRLRTTVVACLALGALMSPVWRGVLWQLFARWLFIGLCALGVFELFARWPRRLPRWLARWVLQLGSVGLSVPVAVLVIYTLGTVGNAVPWWRDGEYLVGFGLFLAVGLLVAPWLAISALMYEVSGAAQRQALAFDLERSQYERQALDAKLRALQAQVEPHFLFNTLANVRELVDLGSPQASSVLGSLISYLRAAVPRLQDPLTTIGSELELVQSYLEIMHLRMPDRLRFSIECSASARAVRCPPSALLTLVENAVRHGIDPSERGGEVRVHVAVRADRCYASVCDTGLGLRGDNASLGTGLATLRERLRLLFAGDFELRLVANQPRGARAELVLPAAGGPA